MSKPKKGPCKTCAAWDYPEELSRKDAASHNTSCCIRHAPSGVGGFARTAATTECFEHILLRGAKAK